MHLLQAIVLGVVQGLTEFLPISSSAHLDIVPSLLGWAKPGAAFTAVIQLGTLLAVLIYFARDIVATLTGAWKDRNGPEARLFLAVIVGTLPIAVIGLALKKVIEGPRVHNLWVNAAMLIVMAIALFVAEKVTRKTRPLGEVTLKDGLIVGFAQALALIPGASRSGSTLTGAFLTGLEKAAAVRFSFLLSLPAVLLSGLVEFKDVLKPKALEPGEAAPMDWSKPDIAIATIVSGIVGYACIAWLLKYLAKHPATVFVVYRIALGLLLIGLLATGKLQP